MLVLALVMVTGFSCKKKAAEEAPPEEIPIEQPAPPVEEPAPVMGATAAPAPGATAVAPGATVPAPAPAPAPGGTAQ